MLAQYRYIELSPDRAGIVDKLENYKGTSYQDNPRGGFDSLITEHRLYHDLSRSDEPRLRRYRDLFGNATMETENKNIVRATMRGEGLEDERFYQKVTRLISRPTQLSVHGGDRKSKEYLNQVG